MSHNAADRKDIRRAEKDAAIADRARAETITSIMTTLGGRTWLWDRLSECHVFHTTHVGGDPLASAFQEGRRSVGLALLADIMAYCPDQFILAMRESHERNLASDTRHSRAVDPTAAGTDAERPGGPFPDGGDSGASPDSDTDTTAPEARGPGWNPGADVYGAPSTETH